MQVIPWIEASVYAPGTYERWLEGVKRWLDSGVPGVPGVPDLPARPAVILMTSPREQALFKRAQYDVRHATILPGLKTNPILSGKQPIAGWLEFGQAARDIYYRTGSRIIVLDNESLFEPAYKSDSFNWTDHQTGISRMAGLVQDLEFWVYPSVRGLGEERDTSIRLVRLFTDAALNCRAIDTVSYWSPRSPSDPEAITSYNKLKAVCARPPIPMLYCFSRSNGGAQSWPAWPPTTVSVGCGEAEKQFGGPVLMFCGNADWPSIAKAWLD